MSALVRRATLRLLSVWPTHEHAPPGTVRYADLVTSTCDARAALTLALGGAPDVDGYPTTAPHQTSAAYRLIDLSPGHPSTIREQDHG